MCEVLYLVQGIWRRMRAIVPMLLEFIDSGGRQVINK